MKLLKKYLLDILVVIVFAVISFVYFMPADMDGRILFRHDSAASKGLGHEKELSNSRLARQLVGPTLCLVVCQPIRCRLRTAVPRCSAR